MKNKKKNTSRKAKKPWPTSDAMKQIYEKNLWGGDTADFYSGYGSHDPEIVNPYINAVTSFLTSFETPLVVCDLGCGNFNVGKELVRYTKKYIATDIVPDLIKRNNEKFETTHLEFKCLDIAKADLPHGDCAIVRQVLQHLSNNEVQRILDKLIQFKYILITEHLPVGEFIPNIDIISGQGTRLKKKSGVDVLAPPFNFKVKEEKEISSVVLNDGKGVIVTTLYTMF
ncbi:class I SAM-dependent methyltransferase [Aquimarina sp. U1-2]|uniref:class I SAM-dependent methyltransferase n=1 Tax=Aquimarina sp. U1-2 TaxID=2823141 RepID=UPI001AECD2AD|nr:class I SAM-dependent methyltransferase [Aquimarina sp. U1-2]MBP2831980.1 class I SAM-dependent methyltransferase [Aquimarina sp. U1-2]